VPQTHVIDFPLIYIIKSFQFTPIPITPVRPGTHPRRKSRATCIDHKKTSNSYTSTTYTAQQISICQPQKKKITSEGKILLYGSVSHAAIRNI
jgi:hypothetical protein